MMCYRYDCYLCVFRCTHTHTPSGIATTANLLQPLKNSFMFRKRTHFMLIGPIGENPFQNVNLTENSVYNYHTHTPNCAIRIIS